MDAHLIGIDLAHFLSVQNASATKRPPVKPAKPTAQSNMSIKESDTKPH
jgi:hypothetical protein